jgi:hypothetical protein
MNMPGFTAEHALHPVIQVYRGHSSADLIRNGSVIPQQYYYDPVERCCARTDRLCRYWLANCCVRGVYCDAAINICGCFCCPL